MREIKFRAWRPSTGQMLPALTLEGIARNLFLSDDIQMEFTGLKDKNGIEVYDGDIIKSNDKWRFEVFWSDYSAGFSATYVGGSEKDPGFSPAITPTTMGVYEVIGNIYEDPELLETK